MRTYKKYLEPPQKAGHEQDLKCASTQARLWFKVMTITAGF